MINKHPFFCCLLAVVWLLTLLAVPRVEADGFPWSRYEGYPNSWFESLEARQIAMNLMSYQTPDGGWPQNIDTGDQRYEGDPKKLRGTFANGAGTGEMRFLARIYNATKNDRYLTPFDKGLKHLLDTQYPTGGWPASFPPTNPNSRQIAFYDDCFFSVLDLLGDVAEGRQYAFLRKEMRETVREAYDKGIKCILKCQLVAKNVPTGWCARYDEKSLEPRPGQKYEPVSICAAETASTLLFLMSVDQPDPAVVRAVNAGCAWYDFVKLPGIRLENKDGDIAVVRDSKAPHLWAKLYEVSTNRPIFCERDGTVKYKLADIAPEMRNRQTWYGPWGLAVAKRYAAWKVQHPMP